MLDVFGSLPLITTLTVSVPNTMSRMTAGIHSKRLLPRRSLAFTAVGSFACFTLRLSGKHGTITALYQFTSDQQDDPLRLLTPGALCCNRPLLRTDASFKAFAPPTFCERECWA